MVLTASQCDAPHIMSLSLVNNASAYAVGLLLTMLQIYLYQYWTVAETQKKGRSAPRPSVDLIIINYITINYLLYTVIHDSYTVDVYDVSSSLINLL